MSELYPTDAELNAMSGTADGEQEVLYIPMGQSPYYTSFYKMLHRLLNVSRRAGDLRVYKDGAMTFGVRAGRYLNGDTPVNFASAAAHALTDNAVNYIYLTAAGVLTVNTGGFPTPSATPHLPLATIATGTASAGGVSGQYALADIADYRGQAILQVAGGPAGVPDGSITNAKIATNAAIARSKMETQQQFPFRVPLTSCRSKLGGPLNTPSKPVFDEEAFYLQTQDWSNGSVVLTTTDIKDKSVTCYCFFEFILPPEYIAGGTINLRVRAGIIGIGEVENFKSITIQSFKINDDGAATSTLGALGPVYLGYNFATYSLTVNSSTLAAGDKVTFYLRVQLAETGCVDTIRGDIGSIILYCDIRG